MGISLDKSVQLIAKHQQSLKWIIYALLVSNFGYYLFDDWRAAQSTLSPDASFLEFTAAYATTFDEIGWFVIIILLEIETYWIEDDADIGIYYWVMQAVRLGCYVVVSHTLYAFIGTVMDLGQAKVLTDIDSVCALVGEDLSFVRNLLFEAIDAKNCATLSSGGEIYRFVGEPVVSDIAGYQLEVRHAWADVIEISGWLSISLLITFIMILQNYGVYESKWIVWADRLQYVVYAMVACTAVYWAVYGFYVYRVKRVFN